MNDDQSLIASVIISQYNEKQYLEACLSSLLDQDIPKDDYEVIYADNSSTDGSADFVAERFPPSEFSGLKTITVLKKATTGLLKLH